MNTKTLDTIQTLAKLGKVLSKIIFILCTIGFFGCLAGITCLSMGFESVKIGGVTIRSLIQNNEGLSTPALYAAMAVGAVLCGAEAFLCKCAGNYFKQELKDGQPFTRQGAKALMRLGIVTIVLPLCASTACAIGLAIAEQSAAGLDKFSIGSYSNAGMGVMMIVGALFCRYGAELNEKKD